MTTNVSIFVLLAGLALLIAGPAVGWFLAVWRLRRREEDVEERERRVKLRELELQRTTFQDSTTRIHASGRPDESDVLASYKEQLEQLALDRDMLEKEHALELKSLHEVISGLRGDLHDFRNDPSAVEDVAFTDDETDWIEAGMDATRFDEPEPVPEPEPEPEPEDTFDFHWTSPLTPPPPVSKPRIESSSPRPEVRMRPSFRPVSDLVDENAPRPLQRLLRLNDDQFGLLDEIGYATVDRIASLTPVAVSRLSEIFGIPASRIEMDWIPDAQKAVFSEEFNSGFNQTPDAEGPPSGS